MEIYHEYGTGNNLVCLGCAERTDGINVAFSRNEEERERENLRRRGIVARGVNLEIKKLRARVI